MDTPWSRRKETVVETSILSILFEWLYRTIKANTIGLIFKLFFSKVIVSDENVAKLSEDVSLVTSNTRDISSDDIFSIANIISNISARTIYSEKVCFLT